MLSTLVKICNKTLGVTQIPPYTFILLSTIRIDAKKSIQTKLLELSDAEEVDAKCHFDNTSSCHVHKFLKLEILCCHPPKFTKANLFTIFVFINAILYSFIYLLCHYRRYSESMRRQKLTFATNYGSEIPSKTPDIQTIEMQ